MNIVFKKIFIKCFQSIGEISLELDNKGIMVVKGINNYEENVKSNGSGKSSIFESIIFALYGETSLGIKDPENRILNNGYDVVLNLSINGVDYTIHRFKESGKASVQLIQNGTDISGRNKTDTDKIIQKELGISKDLFLDSIFLAQGISTNLSSLSPTARKERLEVLTGTEELIEEFKLYIKNRQLGYESKCTELTLNRSMLEGNIQSLNSQINVLELKIEEIKRENESKKKLGNIHDIESEIANVKNQIINNERGMHDIELHISNDLEKQIASNQIIIDSQKTQKTQLEIDKEQINNTLNAQRDVVYNINSSLDNMQNDIASHKRDITRIEQEIETIRTSDTCPTCGRKYEDANEQHIQQKISEYQQEIDQHNASINNISLNINQETEKLNQETEKGKQIRFQYDEKQQQIEGINASINDAEKSNSSIQDDIKVQRNQITDMQSKARGYQNRIEELQNKKEELLKVEIQSTTEYENMITDAKKNIESISKEIADIQEQWNKQNDLVDVCKYSQQLITKPFRTYLLQNSIKLLNEKLEYFSKKLFSNSKDVIIIDGDDSKLDIKLGNATYESLSGGEKTRVNMCLLLAQKYLASSLGNIDCNIIVLDEVLGQCDNEAEMNIIDLIIEELQSVSSIIFIGHKELPIPNDCVLTVVKNEQGLSNLV